MRPLVVELPVASSLTQWRAWGFTFTPGGRTKISPQTGCSISGTCSLVFDDVFQGGLPCAATMTPPPGVDVKLGKLVLEIPSSRVASRGANNFF